MGQQRVPAAGLDHPERGQQHRGGQGRDDLGVAQCETPSGVVAALDSPYTSNATPAVAVTAPAGVEPPGPPPRLRQYAGGQDGDGQPDRHVDEEPPSGRSSIRIFRPCYAQAWVVTSSPPQLDTDPP